MNTDSQIKQFARTVYDPNDTVEIRRLPSGQSNWTTARQLPSFWAFIERTNEPSDGVYIGINPRRTLGGRTAADVLTCRCLVADFDNTQPDEALGRWTDAGLPTPSLLIRSGPCGTHAYLRLAESIQPEVWSVLQAELAAATGADGKIKDPPRIMRLPGTFNRKDADNPTLCEILDDDPERHYAESICRILPRALTRPNPPATPKVSRNPRVQVGNNCPLEQASRYLPKVPGAIEGCGGDQRTYVVACTLVRDFGLTIDEAYPLFAEWNLTCQPPWSEKELRDKLEYALRYGQSAIGSKLDGPGVTTSIPSAAMVKGGGIHV